MREVVCHILSKRPQQGLQLYFKLHLNQRSAHKVMGFQSCRSPKVREFQGSNLGIVGQNDIWVLVPWLEIKNIIRGKVVASPKSKPWWVLWVRVCSCLICAPKVFQLCTNQLVILVAQVHVSNWLACHSL
jgi:hypothetical protein